MPSKTDDAIPSDRASNRAIGTQLAGRSALAFVARLAACSVRRAVGSVSPIDPVCRMNVDPPRAAAQSSYKGETYYFCCTGCKKQFDAAPETYLSK